MTQIYDQFDSATRGISAVALIRDGRSVGRVVLKFGNAATAYVQLWGATMTRAVQPAMVTTRPALPWAMPRAGCSLCCCPARMAAKLTRPLSAHLPRHSTKDAKGVLGSRHLNTPASPSLS